MSYDQSAGGAQPHFRKMYRRVGMAVNSGHHDQKRQLADKLEALCEETRALNLWVNGYPFNQTLYAVAEQLREAIDMEINQAAGVEP